MKYLSAMSIWLLSAVLLIPAGAASAQVQQVLRALNDHPTVKGSDVIKSYEQIFDAYIETAAPPRTVDSTFNIETINPGMDGWDEIAGWAESGLALREAILESKSKTILGLPYGADSVSSQYREAGLIADIGVGGSLRNNHFPWLNAADTIAAFVTAESYRLLEAEQPHEAMDLAVAHLFLVRQYTDRDFLAEKLHSIRLLSSSLSVLRDQFYDYRDLIDAELFTEIAWSELPFLRPDRDKLFLPEADKIVSEALINEVFDRSTSRADPTKFSETFAGIQSENAPLTRFGAARRWERVADVHDGLEASQDRLKLIYDDWWRRWRVREYDLILDRESEFKRTNAIRYAAVLYSVQDVEDLFQIRNELFASVNGTAMAAAVCAYRRTFGNYPNDSAKVYGQFLRKFRSDIDPFDKQYGTLKFIDVSSRRSIDTAYGRLWIEPGDSCIVYSLGQNHEDDRAAQHSDDGLTGDIVYWPPIRAVAREQDQTN